jgi:hypothetical protein
MNITEDYVSFEVAKLLKEKGFHEPCIATYNSTTKNFQVEEIYEDWTIHWKGCISVPTQQMAMKWLREVYHIEINITFGFPFIDGKQQYKYFWSIVRVCDNHLEYPMDDPNSAYYNEEMADSFEEAVEAALKYSLENLI